MVDYEIEALEEKQTADVDPTPNKSTGINVLEDLLKKIVPVLEDDFKLLTTEDEQRQSFRAHIVKAVVDTLTPVDTNTRAAQEASLDEVIDIEVGEPLKMTDWPWFDWYNRPGVVATESNQGASAGGGGPQAANKEEIN